jgi:hypothetical protein
MGVGFQKVNLRLALRRLVYAGIIPYKVNDPWTNL